MTKIFNLKTLNEQVDIANRHALDHAARIADYKSREKALRHEIQSSLAMLEGPARLQAERLLAPEIDKRVRALRTETEKARWHFMREIEAIRVAAVDMRGHLTNPIQLATVANIGSEKRTNYERTVSGLGARALAALAKQASATGDKELASAVILENDKLPTTDRLFSSKKLAEEMWAEESSKAQTLFKALDLSFDRSMALLRDSEGKPMSPTAQLQMGLKHGPGVRLIPNDPNSDESESDDISPLQQLNKGLHAAA